MGSLLLGQTQARIESVSGRGTARAFSGVSRFSQELAGQLGDEQCEEGISHDVERRSDAGVVSMV
jgi:hypothetical protein